MKRLIWLMVFLSISVQADTATKKMSDFDASTTPNADVYVIGVDPNDLTQTVRGSNYRYSLGSVLGSGLLPGVFSSLSATGSGDSWLEMNNNTTFTDSLTGKYGIRFYSGVLQQIINGTPSALGSGVVSDTAYGSSWNGVTDAAASKNAVYDKIETLSAPTFQAADPTIAAATGYFIATTSADYFYNRYGIDTYNLTTGLLVDSDTTAPVIVAGADGTHDGSTPITATMTLTELYPDPSTLLYIITGGTPSSGVWAGTYPNYSLEVTPTGTDPVVVTSAGADLAGNVATGTRLAQTFTYSGGACSTDSVTTANEGAMGVSLTLIANAIGQSFQVTTTNAISGIEFFCDVSTSGAVVEARWGTTPDLSSGYEAATVNIGASSYDTWVSAVFDEKTAPPANTTIYFGLVLISGGVAIGSQSTNPYANGMTVTATSGWNMSTTAASYDLMFRVRQCD